jgi:hypothetical protein
MILIDLVEKHSLKKRKSETFKQGILDGDVSCSLSKEAYITGKLLSSSFSQIDIGNSEGGLVPRNWD